MLFRSFAAAAFAATLAVVVVCLSPAGVLLAQSDLDGFMQKVLARRDDNWKKLQQYVLDEREKIEVRGPGHLPIWGERRDYTWYLRDGYFVRSPVRANGVEIKEADRVKYEQEFLRREQNREKRAKERGGAAAPDRAPSVEGTDPTDAQGLILQTRQPSFISSAYFLKFRFEQGKYALVGKEKLDGRELLRIEYYPKRLFTHEQDQAETRKKDAKRDKEEEVELAMEKLMNKVSLITLWIDPASHQIVKYIFDNVNMDFLPAAWLLRLEDLKATMVMHQPFKDVWLPREVEMYFSAMIAIGSFDARFRLDYTNYKLAETSSRIKKLPEPSR